MRHHKQPRIEQYLRESAEGSEIRWNKLLEVGAVVVVVVVVAVAAAAAAAAGAKPIGLHRSRKLPNFFEDGARRDEAELLKDILMSVAVVGRIAVDWKCRCGETREYAWWKFVVGRREREREKVEC